MELDDVHKIDRVIDAIGLSQRELIILVLLGILGLILYVAVIMYRFKIDCKRVSCRDIEHISITIDKALITAQDISTTINNTRVETRETLKDIQEDVSRLEKGLLDARLKIHEMGGVVFYSGSMPINKIRHSDDS